MNNENRIYNYKGHLEIYFETGICFSMIYLNHSNPDPWSKTFVLDKKTKILIKIMHPVSKEVVYFGDWTYSRENTALNRYLSSPVEIEASLWKEYLQKQYPVEFSSHKPAEADLNSLVPGFNIDIWELKDNNKILIARDAKIFKIAQGQTLVVDKSPQRWVSQSEVLSFQADKDQIFVRTEKESFEIKKTESALLENK